jgi:mono/diheme cytochrome c family protein
LNKFLDEVNGIMTTKQLKAKLAATAIMLPLMAFAIFNTAAVRNTSAATDDEAAALFKAKCVMCHGAKADKKFDPTKPDDELLQTVLKSGKPGMPAYETKGINEAQAKAIIAHMKSLRQQ